MTAQTLTQTAVDTETLTGAEIVVRALVDQGVEVLFGYPGGAVLPIYDALFQQDAHRSTSWSATSRAPTHAAEGYARSTGKPGVVLVTSGPGATNAVTGIADALMDSIPLVVHHRPGAHPPDRHRRLPGSATRSASPAPCTKHNYLVKDVGRPRRGSCTRPSTSPPPAGPGRWSSTSRRTSSSATAPLPGAGQIMRAHSYRPRTEGDPARIAQAARLMIAGASGRSSTPAAA
jgi:acetolactate synthase-1/2/3 large subunit